MRKWLRKKAVNGLYFFRIKPNSFDKFEILHVVSKKLHSSTNRSGCNQGIGNMKTMTFSISFNHIYCCFSNFLVQINDLQFLQAALYF